MLEYIEILITNYRHPILSIGLGILFLTQFLAFWKKRNFSKSKITLNGSLLILVALYIFQPSWKKEINTQKVLIIADTIGTPDIQKVQDSLHITETFDAETFRKTMIENQNFIEKLGKIYIFGQNIDSSSLHLLANHSLSWIPFFKPKELQDISWEAVNYQGEIQRVEGKIKLDKPEMLYLKLGNTSLDSLSLPKGISSFVLKSPIASIGKVKYELKLNNDLLHEIIFFSIKPQPLSILFVQSNADFENKTLSDFWAKKGHHLTNIVQISKENNSTFFANKAKEMEAEIIVCDAEKANHELINKSFQNGKSILFTNISKPNEFIGYLNNRFNTKFQIKSLAKESQKEETASFSDAIIEAPFQESLDNYPIAVQQNSSKIGINLVSQTFPLLLSGDSLAYSKIWMQTLELLKPETTERISIKAPIFVNRRSIIQWKSKFSQKSLTIDSDKIQSESSVINETKHDYPYFFRSVGWHTLQDSISIYVADNQSTIAKSKIIESYLSGDSYQETTSKQAIEQKLSETIWLGLFLFCLILLWLEPKLNIG